jgi:hypothetical protein
MATQEHNTTKPIERPIPGLRNLLSLEFPKFERHYGTDSVTYRFSCEKDELERLKSAVDNAGNLLDSGIEVIGHMLSHVGMYKPEEFDAKRLRDAGWLIAELAQCRGRIDDMAYILEHAEIAE